MLYVMVVYCFPLNIRVIYYAIGLIFISHHR